MYRYVNIYNYILYSTSLKYYDGMGNCNKFRRTVECIIIFAHQIFIYSISITDYSVLQYMCIIYPPHCLRIAYKSA